MDDEMIIFREARNRIEIKSNQRRLKLTINYSLSEKCLLLSLFVDWLYENNEN